MLGVSEALLNGSPSGVSAAVRVGAATYSHSSEMGQVKILSPLLLLLLLSKVWYEYGKSAVRLAA